MKKTIHTMALVAGGTLDVCMIPQIRAAQWIVGVDRGAWWLLSHKIVPQVAIGDFDSVTEKELASITRLVPEVIRYPAEKDATDLELAVAYAIKKRVNVVEIFGARGTRFDHEFAGMQVLLNLASHNVMGYIVDNFCKTFIVVRRLERVEKSDEYKYLSIFPFGKDAVITLKGFKYGAARRRFKLGSTLGVSNEIQARIASITVHSGAVLVVRSRD